METMVELLSPQILSKKLNTESDEVDSYLEGNSGPGS